MKRKQAVAFVLASILSLPAFSVELKTLLDRLAESAPPEEAALILNALVGADALQKRLTDAAASGALKSINIGKSNGLFKASISKGSMVLDPELLRALQKTRRFDFALPDEVPPDNTVFVLSHLIYHLTHPGKPPQDSSFDEFVKDRLETEARGFIQAWNDMVDAVERRNGKAITVRQSWGLLSNMRYGFPFIIKGNREGESIFDGVRIPENDRNVAAIARQLERSSVADIE